MKPKKRVLKSGKVRWDARYRDHHGKEHQKSFSREKDAKQWVQDELRKIRKGEWVDPEAGKITVRELMELHRDRAERPNTKSVRNTISRGLGPLGEIPIKDVQQIDIQSWVDALKNGREWANGKPLKDSTIDMYISVMHGAFSYAVTAGMISESPMKNFKTGRRVKKVQRAEIPTSADIDALVKEARIVDAHRRDNRQLARIIRIAADTGLRSGEICGLRRQDLDFERKEIHVVTQTDRVTGELGPLKTVNSSRVVPMTEVAERELKLQIQGGPDRQDGMLFESTRGGLLTSAHVGKQFRTVAKHAGLPYTFHSLRHYYVTRLLDSGVPVHVVASLVGHSTISITDIYSHVTGRAIVNVRGILSSAG